MSVIETRQKDRAHTIKALTSMASVLADAGLLNPQQAQDLRIHLSTPLPQGTPSLLVHLKNQNDDFLLQLITRYGELGIAVNFFRYALRAAIADLAAELTHTGEQALSRMRIVFNRPFILYVNTQPHKTALCASPWVEFAEFCNEDSEQLINIMQKLSVFCCNNLVLAEPEDHAIDQKIAEQLGLDHMAPIHLPLALERRTTLSLSNVLKSFLMSCRGLLEQLQANGVLKDGSRLNLLMDAFESEVHALAALPIPQSCILEHWEKRKEDFLDKLFKIKLQIAEWDHELNSQFNVDFSQSHLQNRHSEDLSCRIASYLIKSGTSAYDAQKAAKALVEYQHKAQVPAQEILPGELSKINAHLSVESLEVLRQWEQDKNLSFKSEEKARNLEREKKLLESFHAKLNALGLLTWIGIFWGLSYLTQQACGLKMSPESELIDYRPAVIYHAQKPEKNNTNKPDKSLDQDTHHQKNSDKNEVNK